MIVFELYRLRVLYIVICMTVCNCFVVFLIFSLGLQNYAMTVPDGFAFMYVNISHYRYHVSFYMRDVQKYVTSH